jgi:hypothetical protein
MAAILIGCFEPFQESDLKFGNVNWLQFGMLAVFLMLQSGRPTLIRDILSGFILAIAVLFKPNIVFVPLACLAIWVLYGQFGKILAATTGMIAGAVTAATSSLSLFASLSCWSQWLGAMRRLTEDTRSVRDSNIGLDRLLYDWSRLQLGPYILALAVILLLALAWRGRRGSPLGQSARRQAFLGVGLGVALYLMSSFFVWWHYYVLLSPLLIYCCRPLHARGDPAGSDAIVYRAMAAVALILMLPFFASVPGLEGYVGASVRSNTSVLILFALGFWDLHNSLAERPSKTDRSEALEEKHKSLALTTPDASVDRWRSALRYP